jgi:hypothetical protein
MKGLTLATFKVTDRSLDVVRLAGVPPAVLKKLETIKGHEVSGQGHFLALLQQTIGYEETAKYQQVILRAAATKRKRLWRRPLKKPSLSHYIWKIVHSTILSIVILLATFGLKWLSSILFPDSADPTVGIIKEMKNLASVGMFVVYLVVKVLNNLGIIGD